MSQQHEAASRRESLDFAHVVKDEFSFLSNFGFVMVDATPTLVRFAGPGVKQLADLTRRYGERALRDDPRFFQVLEQNRLTASQAYELEVRAEQVRPRAAGAFKQGRYAEAAALYESILEASTDAERKKLQIARDRS